MFDMAYHGGESPTKIEDIARREDISARFLEQIFKDLKRAELIQSKRGPKGGYFLARPQETITIAHIIAAVEGPLDELLCRDGKGDDVSEDAHAASLEVTATMWREMAASIHGLLSGVSLQTLVDRAEENGVERDGFKGFIYVI